MLINTRAHVYTHKRVFVRAALNAITSGSNRNLTITLTVATSPHANHELDAAHSAFNNTTRTNPSNHSYTHCISHISICNHQITITLTILGVSAFMDDYCSLQPDTRYALQPALLDAITGVSYTLKSSRSAFRAIIAAI